MENKQWKYKVGGRAQGLIPSLLLFAVFGGVTIYLHLIHHGAFLFGLLLTAIMLILIILSIFRGIFVKVLLGEDGFYHQTKPGNGRYYRYSEIKEVWQNEGKELNGATGYFCSYETYEGKTVKFPFLPLESEGIDYFIERVQECGIQNVSADINDTAKEYTIDGKTYGKTAIIASLVLLVLFLALTVPAMLQIRQKGVTGSIGFGRIDFFVWTGILAIGAIFILLVLRYCCFKVQIGSTGFYFRSTPFNGRYYSYGDIKSCKIEKKVYRRRDLSGRGAVSNHRLYYYYFIFTDQNGKTIKFQFQKPISGHEVEILKERIERQNERLRG